MSWIDEIGPMNDIVLSSRIRLARNISGHFFPAKMSAKEAQRLIQQIEQALLHIEPDALHIERIEALPIPERTKLLEQHLISRELLENHQNAAVIMDSERKCGAMVNEEDHLRIQCIFPGYQLDAALEKGFQLDDDLGSELRYVFDEALGYLTACPTNTGTGLRASVMMHLPGLVASKSIMPILVALSKVGITVRGLFGEGSKAQGNIFQISNQVTLGMSEQEIVSSLKTAVEQIAERERMVNEVLRSKNPKSFDDRIWRAKGILENAQLLTLPESLELLSRVRMGVSMRLLSGISFKDLNRLITEVQPMHLLINYQIDTEESDKQDLNALRAQRVRSIFKDFEPASAS